MFKFENIKNFETYITNSIPDYKGLVSLISNIGKEFISKDSIVYDFGVSTGSIISNFSYANCIGVDLVEFECEKNFKFIKGNCVDIIKTVEKADVILSIFTAQFLGVHRESFVKDLIRLNNNGAIIFFAEKVYFDNSKINSIIARDLLRRKRQNFSDKEILDKEEQLPGSMFPLTETEIQKELSQFKNPLQIWQSYNFRCWVLL